MLKGEQSASADDLSVSAEPSSGAPSITLNIATKQPQRPPAVIGLSFETERT